MAREDIKPEQGREHLTVTLGANCPDGCTVRSDDGRDVPERLVEAMPGSGDGELVCPICWEAWNTFTGERS